MDGARQSTELGARRAKRTGSRVPKAQSAPLPARGALVYSAPVIPALVSRSPAFIAFLMSGASSLIFQSIWSRLFHHVFGSTGVAISTVVTAFMMGLGLGAWLSGRYVDRIKHPIITYAIIELFVGLWALLLPFMVDPEGWLASANAFFLNSLGSGSFTLTIARFVLVLPFLLVPTTLMGATLPLLARHFVQTADDERRAASKVGILYAINTAGAVLGTFFAAFVLMPTVGLLATEFVAVAMNVLLGLGIFATYRQLLGNTYRKGEGLRFWPEKVKTAPSGVASSAEGGESPREAEPAAKDDAPKKTRDKSKGEASEAKAGPTKRKKKKKKAAEKRVVKGKLPPDEDAPLATPAPASMSIPRIARYAAFATFAASGLAALGYEMVWTRSVVMTIGSSVHSFGIVLLTFLIGIAGGSAICAGFLSRDRVPRLVATAIVTAFLLAIALAPWGVNYGLVVYVVVFFASLIPVGIVFAVSLQFRPHPFAPQDAVSPWPVLAMLGLPALFALANLAIFLDTRGESIKLDELSPIVGAVVICIALMIASFAIFHRAPILVIAVTQFMIAVCAISTYYFQDEVPYAFARLVTTIEDIPDHVTTIQFFMFFTAGLCTLPATIGMGAMFPLTIRAWTVGGGGIGKDVGLVYAGNTVGSIIGAWLPGFVLMPLIGVELTLILAIVLNLLLALAMVIASVADTTVKTAVPPEDSTADAPEGRPEPNVEFPLWQAITVYVLALALPALVAVLLVAGWNEGFGQWLGIRWKRDQMTLGVFRISLAKDVLDPDSWGRPDLVYYKDGLSTTVSVERWGRHLAMKNNGKVDASNGDDMPTQIMVAALPLLMHERGPEDLDVAIIGFGSGVTVGAALEFPVKSVKVIELERRIPEASMFFADVNHLEYPGCDDTDDETPCEFPYARAERLEVINDDGRNYLSYTDERFDVIMSEPSNPWITGVSDLFTTDHWRITKQRLRPGGIYCQWVQLYELSPANIKTIYRTFADQFAHVVVFAAEDLSSDTIILGSDSPLPLDLARIRRPFADPEISAELERAYIHSPFDVFARVLLASKSEVMEYTQLEYRLREGEWVPFYESSNETECNPRDCRRVPAPLNTDDNALIEFAAPHDLIGFEAYEGYLANIYSPDWPFGHLIGQVRGFGEGEEAGRNEAEMAMALIGHGRKAEAGDFIRQAVQHGSTREALVAAEVLRMLLSDDGEPRITIEPPVPGPEMDRRAARVLREGFEAVRSSVDARAYGAALTAMESIDAPIRMHSGPSMQFLYGYLLYKAAEGSPQRYRAAIDELEELVRSNEEYVRRHPELYYFLARAHDAEFNFDKALRNMRFYVEAQVVPGADHEDLPEPPREDAPTTDEPGESPKDVHPDRVVPDGA
jgi:spermidine synthase/MFS family permease